MNKTAMLPLVLLALTGPAEAAPPPDMPGVGLDKLVWGMSAEQVRELYPVIGRNPTSLETILISEDTSLRTGDYLLAGCKYTVMFSVGYARDGAPGDIELRKMGVQGANFELNRGQPDKCVADAVDRFHVIFGKSVYDTAAPGQHRQWRTDRTVIDAGEHSDGPHGKAFRITMYQRTSHYW